MSWPSSIFVDVAKFGLVFSAERSAQSRFPSTDHLFFSIRNPPEYALSSELVARAVGRVPPLGNSGRVTLVFM
jgi:hypothetical protein